jgi:16S rRNA (uracil1498-N3)-methyltransferase
MRIPRFYCPPPLALGGRVSLPPDAAHHAIRVLRMKEGDGLALFDGAGNEFMAKVLRMDKQSLTAIIEAPQANDRESPLRIVLAQGISSGDRMDYTLQKAVELGVTEILPVATERSVVKLSGERMAKRVVHWQNVVISACEQCGRSTVPEVHAVNDFADWLALETEAASRIVLVPGAKQRLADLPRPQGRIVLLAGPEGGLTQDELSSAQELRGFVPVRLGPRILRTETAALAAIAGMQTLWGDH